jgi:lysophospholipase L1-like esterase
MNIKTGEKILFIGDSITDCNRRTTEAPLGDGYVQLFANMLTIRQPEIKIDIINKGISGDTASGLRNRWHDDVIHNHPDFLSIKVGINDLHRTLEESPEAVPPEEFKKAYNTILARTKSELPNCKILLIDPFFISAEKSSLSFRNTVLNFLPEYLQIVHEMSEKFNTLLIKTHDKFQQLLKYNETDRFCPEPVHPNLTGHMVIAEAVYNTLKLGI